MDGGAHLGRLASLGTFGSRSLEQNLKTMKEGASGTDWSLERKLEEEQGRYLLRLASLGTLGAQLLERKLAKHKGRHLGHLASLGTLSDRLLEREFEARCAYGY